MAETTPSLESACQLLKELRLGIRRIEVAQPGRENSNTDTSRWTKNAIEAFNNSSIRTVSACREALAEARYEAERRQNDLALHREGTLVKVVQAERDLEHVRMELRRAITMRKRHEERRSDTADREALLGAVGGDNTRRRKLVADDDGGDNPESAAGQARETKQSLQRTRKMMAEQLARVAHVSEMMGEQDALLMNTYAEHQGIGGSLKRAGTTLTRLKAAEVMDTVIMVASTLLFFATVCFVLYQRVPLLGLL